jgi:hypothetical protein
LFAEQGGGRLWTHGILVAALDLCANSYQAMQAILRKYSPGLMTAAIYTGILLFALLCTFAGR